MNTVTIAATMSHAMNATPMTNAAAHASSPAPEFKAIRFTCRRSPRWMPVPAWHVAALAQKRLTQPVACASNLLVRQQVR
jgi:hypothetical protein